MTCPAHAGMIPFQTPENRSNTDLPRTRGEPAPRVSPGCRAQWVAAHQTGMSTTYRIEPKLNLPELAEAQSVLLAVMSHVGVDTLEQLQQAWAGRDPGFKAAMSQLLITDHQIDLLERHDHPLRIVDRVKSIRDDKAPKGKPRAARGLAPAPSERPRPVTMLMVCTHCNGWLPIEGGSRGLVSCLVTAACPGKMNRATDAKIRCVDCDETKSVCNCGKKSRTPKTAAVPDDQGAFDLEFDEVA